MKHQENSLDMNRDIEEYIILLIVYTCPNLSNSYDLNKIMSWKFDTIDISNKLDNLICDNILERNETDKVYKYEYTKKGVDLLMDNYSFVKNESLLKFPLQYEFLKILFEKFELISNLPDGTDL
jgi:predicted transcriptional regulator